MYPVLQYGILIQDPANECSYLLQGTDLASFAVDAPSGKEAVTFTISDSALLDLAPTSAGAMENRSTVVIRDLDHRSLYEIPFDRLEEYSVPFGSGVDNAKIFTIPMRQHLLEVMSYVLPALGQHSGFIDPNTLRS